MVYLNFSKCYVLEFSKCIEEVFFNEKIVSLSEVLHVVYLNLWHNKSLNWSKGYGTENQVSFQTLKRWLENMGRKV